MTGFDNLINSMKKYDTVQAVSYDSAGAGAQATGRFRVINLQSPNNTEEIQRFFSGQQSALFMLICTLEGQSEVLASQSTMQRFGAKASLKGSIPQVKEVEDLDEADKEISGSHETASLTSEKMVTVDTSPTESMLNLLKERGIISHEGTVSVTIEDDEEFKQHLAAFASALQAVEEGEESKPDTSVSLASASTSGESNEPHRENEPKQKPAAHQNQGLGTKTFSEKGKAADRSKEQDKALQQTIRTEEDLDRLETKRDQKTQELKASKDAKQLQEDNLKADASKQRQQGIQ